MTVVLSYPANRLSRYRKDPTFSLKRKAFDPITRKTDKEILDCLAFYRFLTAELFAAALGSPKSSKYYAERLSAAFHGGYLRRVWKPRSSPGGAPKAVYCLDKRGWDYLAFIGKVDGRFNASEEGE